MHLFTELNREIKTHTHTHTHTHTGEHINVFYIFYKSEVGLIFPNFPISALHHYLNKVDNQVLEVDFLNKIQILKS